MEISNKILELWGAMELVGQKNTRRAVIFESLQNVGELKIEEL